MGILPVISGNRQRLQIYIYGDGSQTRPQLEAWRIHNLTGESGQNFGDSREMPSVRTWAEGQGSGVNYRRIRLFIALAWSPDFFGDRISIATAWEVSGILWG